MLFLGKIRLKLGCQLKLMEVYVNEVNISLTHSLTDSSRSLNDCWGIRDDRATTFLHSSLSSAFRRASPNPNPIRSDILYSHFFFCLPFLLPPCILPCRIIFASPVDLVMCPYHLNLRFLISRYSRTLKNFFFTASEETKSQSQKSSSVPNQPGLITESVFGNGTLSPSPTYLASSTTGENVRPLYINPFPPQTPSIHSQRILPDNVSHISRLLAEIATLKKENQEVGRHFKSFL